MFPEIHSGDYILCSSLPLRLGFLKIGQTIVFRDAEYGLLVKKVCAFSKDGKNVFFQGTRPSSLTSDELGPVERSEILGIMLFRIPMKG